MERLTRYYCKPPGVEAGGEVLLGGDGSRAAGGESVEDRGKCRGGYRWVRAWTNFTSEVNWDK